MYTSLDNSRSWVSFLCPLISPLPFLQSTQSPFLYFLSFLLFFSQRYICQTCIVFLFLKMMLTLPLKPALIQLALLVHRGYCSPSSMPWASCSAPFQQNVGWLPQSQRACGSSPLLLCCQADTGGRRGPGGLRWKVQRWVLCRSWAVVIVAGKAVQGPLLSAAAVRWCLHWAAFTVVSSELYRSIQQWGKVHKLSDQLFPLPSFLIYLHFWPFRISMIGVWCYAFCIAFLKQIKTKLTGSI